MLHHKTFEEVVVNKLREVVGNQIFIDWHPWQGGARGVALENLLVPG